MRTCGFLLSMGNSGNGLLINVTLHGLLNLSLSGLVEVNGI